MPRVALEAASELAACWDWTVAVAILEILAAGDALGKHRRVSPLYRSWSRLTLT